MQKKFFKRYVWLIDLLQRRGGLTLKQIQELWLQSDLCDDGQEMPVRTFQYTRDAIYSNFGIEIICGSHYKYFIKKESIENGAMKWMLEAISLNRILGEAVDLKDKVIFEEIPSSNSKLEIFLYALRDKVCIEMDYQGLNMSEPKRMQIEPWCLRIFKQRWYLIGWSINGNKSGMRTYLLERATNVTLTNVKIAHMPKGFNGIEFLAPYYGVHQGHKECKKERIDIKVMSKQRLFLRELPLHHSQEEIKTEDTYSIFSYKLIWNFDFKQELLSWGSQVEVISPKKRKLEMIEELHKTLDNYEKD